MHLGLSHTLLEERGDDTRHPISFALAYALSTPSVGLVPLHVVLVGLASHRIRTARCRVRFVTLVGHGRPNE